MLCWSFKSSSFFLALFLLSVMNTMMFNNPSHFSKSESCIMQVQRSKSNFLHRGVCSPLDGVIGRRESSAELGERSDKLQRGARMPGQRRAGQLVHYSSQKTAILPSWSAGKAGCLASIEFCTPWRNTHRPWPYSFPRLAVAHNHLYLFTSSCVTSLTSFVP